MDAVTDYAIRPPRLSLVPPLTDSERVTDADREARVLRKLLRALEEALEELPVTSRLRFPLLRVVQAARDELSRPGRRGP